MPAGVSAVADPDSSREECSLSPMALDSQPSVSILIPVRNEARHLPALLGPAAAGYSAWARFS